jgi:hypothetical protein
MSFTAKRDDQVDWLNRPFLPMTQPRQWPVDCRSALGYVVAAEIADQSSALWLWSPCIGLVIFADGAAKPRKLPIRLNVNSLLNEDYANVSKAACRQSF